MSEEVYMLNLQCDVVFEFLKRKCHILHENFDYPPRCHHIA